MKNNKPIISVIMAAYNAEKYISECIESVLNQTLRDFEFVIIDDGSSDNTYDIIKKYSEKDERIKLIKNSKNFGLVRSINVGLEQAKGKYIARMDADDICLIDRFEFQTDFLDSNREIFLVGGSFYYIDEDGKILFTQINNYDSEKISKKLPYRSMIHHPTVMFRNTGDIFYREKAIFSEDRDLWLRFLTEGKKMVVLPKIVLKYRFHEGSICCSNLEKQKRMIKQVVQWYFERRKNGADSYDSFVFEDVFNKNLIQANNSKYFKDKLMLELAFKNNSNREEFRKNLRFFWAKYGFFIWKKSILEYLVSFLPYSIIKQLISKFTN